MVICIAGMHRSGTSLVARVLHECGLHLGSQDELLPPNAENREGFWENRRFVELNEELLATLGGSWHSPPVLARGWEQDERLAALKRRAAELIRDLRENEPWGWKDPRSSLTIRFWQELLPKLRVVQCVRDPIEVSESLERRGLPSNTPPLDLWLRYNRELAEAVNGHDRVVTHYDSYFRHAEEEVRRLVELLDLESTGLQIAHGIAVVNEAVRHHRAEGHPAAAELELPPGVEECYAELRRAADGDGVRKTNTTSRNELAEPADPFPAKADEPASEFPYTAYDDSPGSTHNMVVDLVPVGARVLEFGCATGYMSAVLKERRNATVTGIEISPEAAAAAEGHCDRVIVGDAEALDLAELLRGEQFDAIIFADVLEHLRDPRAVLRGVRGVLSDRGSVIASVPNVAHGSVRLALLAGEFRYTETGLLDKTHMRFFTRESLQDLFEEAGYAVTSVHRRRIAVDESDVPVPSHVSPEARRAALGDLEATTYQFVVTAAPAGSASQLHALRDKLGAARAELEQLRSDHQERAALRAELDELQLAHEAVRRRMVAERAAFAEYVNELERTMVSSDITERQSEELASQADKIEELQRTLGVISNSRSLRYTAPMRRLGAFVRRSRR
jgi:2-polyprenyl-3-methyl-5-hydroxy-6-metoxy-1,4-benzoquinol methylase